MLDSGSIIEMGSYDELRKKEHGPFSEFIRNFLSTQERGDIGGLGNII
jgi:ABC-type multidrug transport system fused ATPase/permease subunit